MTYARANERARAVYSAMIKGGTTPQAATVAAERTRNAHLDVLSTVRNVKPAHAAKLTEIVRGTGAHREAPDLPALRYAGERDVTGAIPKTLMRVKRASGNGGPCDGGPKPAVDMIASHVESARRTACADLRALIRDFPKAKCGTIKRSLRLRIYNLLKAWGEDVEVIGAARDAGWRV